MRKCLLINCFASSNENRIEPIKKWFDVNGFETKYYSSNFHHAKKDFVDLPNYIIPVETLAYKKNLSFRRLISHIKFSKKIYKILLEEKPDFLYIKFPPNSLVKYAARYKKKYNCRLIFDVFDLWPESLPISKFKKIIIAPFSLFWKVPRNGFLKYGDLVLTECDMYKEFLHKFLPANAHTLYLSKKDYSSDCFAQKTFLEKKPNTISLCYLGGINNLIDIELIGRIIFHLRSYGNIELNIIGDGGNRDSLIKMAEQNGANVLFHGIIFDEAKKRSIMSCCDFGLNIMKTEVKVALTLKSIEYFRAGLALINNIPGDTSSIIHKTGSGINVKTDGSFPFKLDDLETMKKASRNVFESFFEEDIVVKRFENVIRESNLL